MLVQQTQTSQNPNKEKIILVLKDLVSLQQIASSFAKIGSPEVKIQSNGDAEQLVKLINLMNGLFGLQQKSPMMMEFQKEMKMVFLVILKSAKETC